jgi:hypothetical protein
MTVINAGLYVVAVELATRACAVVIKLHRADGDPDLKEPAVVFASPG